MTQRKYQAPAKSDAEIFPSETDLAVFHASPVELDLDKPYFGWDPISWDYLDWRFTMCGGLTELMQSIADAVTTRGFKLLFFLPKEYDLAPFVRRVRRDHTEVGMMNTWARPPRDFHKPVLVDLLLVKNIDTLNDLCERSDHFRRFLPVVEGQPPEETWVYFLVPPCVITDGDWVFKR